MNNKSQKQDTSTLLKTRHFYFGLTFTILGLDFLTQILYHLKIIYNFYPPSFIELRRDFD